MSVCVTKSRVYPYIEFCAIATVAISALSFNRYQNIQLEKHKEDATVEKHKVDATAKEKLDTLKENNRFAEHVINKYQEAIYKVLQTKAINIQSASICNADVIRKSEIDTINNKIDSEDEYILHTITEVFTVEKMFKKGKKHRKFAALTSTNDKYDKIDIEIPEDLFIQKKDAFVDSYYNDTTLNLTLQLRDSGVHIKDASLLSVNEAISSK